MVHGRDFIKLWCVLSTFAISSVDSQTALLIIDVQNCFLPGGSLAVTDGEKIIPVINNIRRKFSSSFALTVFTQDWHCADHVSFASQHNGSSPFEIIPLRYNASGSLCPGNTESCLGGRVLNQTLWPDHCVINSTSAEFSTELIHEPADVVVKKGYHCQIDSYSGFFDNGGFSKTELEDILNKERIKTVIVTGLALDFCVYYTSKDAHSLGFEVYLVQDASRPVSERNVPGVLADLRNKGVHVINSSDLDKVISSSNNLTISIINTLFCAAITLRLHLCEF